MLREKKSFHLLMAGIPMLLAASFALTGCKVGEPSSHPLQEIHAGKTAYHCSMHPQIVSDRPGDCPICGMKLVPIEKTPNGGGEGAATGKYPVVYVPSSTARNIGVRILRVGRHSFGEGPDSIGPVAIPAQSLVRTGGRQVVVVYLGGERYQPRDVQVGRETREWVEILEGLTEGSEIVVSGEFLLDTESELQATAHQVNEKNDHVEKAGAEHE